MTGTFPPENFVPTASAVDGITVYRPASADADSAHQQVVDFKCPNCGADRGFDAADGGLTCAFCGYHEAPEAQQVGLRAQQFEFTPETMQQATHGWGVERLQLHCENCGANTTLPAESLSHTCPFCHSVNVVQQKAPQDLLRPRFLIPLRLVEQECQDCTRRWLGSSWMTPGTLRHSALLKGFTPIYLPFWTFDASTSASWRAEVGRTKGSGKNRRTVWRWEDGHVQLQIDDLLVPGSEQVSELLAVDVSDYDLSALVEYKAEFMAGIQAQAYERPLNVAWELGRQEMREMTKVACKKQASTNKIRNFSMNMDFSDEAWRYILLPMYVSSYEYRGRRFQVLVNGQTGRVSGQRPASWGRVLGVIALMMVLPLGLALATTLLNLYDPDGLRLTSPLLQGLRDIAIVIYMATVGVAGLAWRIIQKALALDDI